MTQAGENRRGESLIGERTVDDRVGDPYAGDVDGAGAEKFFEDGEEEGHCSKEEGSTARNRRDSLCRCFPSWGSNTTSLWK